MLSAGRTYEHDRASTALHFAMQAIGVDLDLVEKGLGIRSRRYAMLVDNGTVSRCALQWWLRSGHAWISRLSNCEIWGCRQVSELNLEEGGAFTVSSAEEILSGKASSGCCCK